MAVQLPCYSTREQVKRALDIKQTASNDAQVDRAIEAARDDVNGLCKRRFYNVIGTQYWDWPGFQRAYPWRIWFDERELADITALVPVVTSGGNVITAANIKWGPWNYSPPFTFLELDRSKGGSFGQGATPQQDVAILGLFGYWDKRAAAGALASAVTDTTSTTVTVSNGAALGVGDVLIAGTERMLIQDKQMADTGQALTSGGTTAQASDVLLGVTTGSAFAVNEVLQVDAERMLITSITGNSLTVKRAWDGTVLAAHATPEIYAARLLTVTRGDLGSTAATHTQSSALSVQAIPALVNELSVAEAIDHVLQETAGYARSLPQGAGAVPGTGLPDLRGRCRAQYGRKIRQRVA